MVVVEEVIVDRLFFSFKSARGFDNHRGTTEQLAARSINANACSIMLKFNDLQSIEKIAVGVLLTVGTYLFKACEVLPDGSITKSPPLR